MAHTVDRDDWFARQSEQAMHLATEVARATEKLKAAEDEHKRTTRAWKAKLIEIREGEPVSMRDRT